MYKIRATSLKEITPLTARDVPVMGYVNPLKNVLKQRFGGNFADILATPILSNIDDEIDWYTEQDDIVCIDKLSESEQHELLIQLNEQMQALRNLLEQTDEKNSDFFEALRLALNIPHKSYIYRVHGRPVIVAWGFIGRHCSEKLDLFDGLSVAEKTLVPEPATLENEALTNEHEQTEQPALKERIEEIRKKSTIKRILNWCWLWALLAFLLGLILGCLLCCGGINLDWRWPTQEPDEEEYRAPGSSDTTDKQSVPGKLRETTPAPSSFDATDERSAIDRLCERVTSILDPADTTNEPITETSLPQHSSDNINETVCEQFNQLQPIENIMFVLDGSSSMNELMKPSVSSDFSFKDFFSKFISKPSRMKVAKKSLNELMKTIPDETHVGLVAFRGCENLLIAEPTSKINSNFMKEIVNSFETGGGTDLINSATKAAELLKKNSVADKKSIIMVLTDGEQNCGDGELCQVARNLHQKYPDIHINVIDMSGAGRASCLAEETNGLVFNPKDSDQILSMMRQSAGRAIPVECLKFNNDNFSKSQKQ